jgi:putative ABC transport system permease protein
VLALVIGMAARLAGAGIAAGLVVSLASRRVMESLVAGVEGFDVVIYAAVGVIVLGVSAAAALVPAWRASRIDPLAVLRQ